MSTGLQFAGAGIQRDFALGFPEKRTTRLAAEIFKQSITEFGGAARRNWLVLIGNLTTDVFFTTRALFKNTTDLLS